MKGRMVLGMVPSIVVALPLLAGVRAPTEAVNMPRDQYLEAGSYPDEIGSIA